MFVGVHASSPEVSVAFGSAPFSIRYSAITPSFVNCSGVAFFLVREEILSVCSDTSYFTNFKLLLQQAK